MPPKATSLEKIRNHSNPFPRYPTRCLGSWWEGDDSDSSYEDIDTEDTGATTPCGWPAAMDSASALMVTSP